VGNGILVCNKKGIKDEKKYKKDNNRQRLNPFL
jgi:hypothetical protein